MPNLGLVPLQLFVAAVVAFAVQDAPAPTTSSAKHDPAAAPLAAGKRALAEGKRAEAVAHFERALAVAPDSIEILALLVEASAEDADARTLWLHALATAAVAPDGSVPLDPKLWKKLDLLAPDVPRDPHPESLASARVAAVDEMLKLAREKEKEGQQRPDALLVAQWARRVAFDLVRESPVLSKAHEDELSPRLTLPGGLPEKAVRLLESFGTNALANGRTADAIKAGRILAGFANQIRFGKDLQGPKPTGLGSLGERADALLERARVQLAGKSEKPWTVDELSQLLGDEAEAFTRAHDTFANPGIAVSPNGWYRIETDCGFETLLGAANTVELHHKRLAGWYGEDPFVGRPGLVRIVPEAAGLESEGAPFWWAGGFQGGDTTTVRFSCGTIEGLGHLLTHELTHRFDGAIYPGMPSWLMEGRAVWTGGAYGRSSDEKFVERWAALGTIEAALLKGYGDANNLTKLIEGTIDDYRDNYTAGFALFVYLNTRRDESGRLLFHDRLPKFMKEARSVKKWKEHFVECFCDGREGRPKDFQAFVAAWAPWLAGFYWQGRERNPWVLEYTQEVPAVGEPPLVMDEPTWVWTRARAEPRFGQEQAAASGRLLLSAGRRADAIALLVWALAVDGRRPSEEAALAEALERENRRDSAWVLKQGVEFPYGARVGPPPFASATSKTRAFLAALEAASADAAARKLEFAAAVLRADRERLASWLGIAAIAPTSATEPLLAIDASKRLHPLDPASRPLAPRGYTESGLTDYEERRRKGLWYVDESGVLHVGREKPRQASSTVDRGSAQVDCFALAPEWILPGTWRLDARIRFTTSFANGVVVFGYAEREQNLRFGFSAGDFMYAVGASEKEPEFTKVGWWLGGLRERDGGLLGSTQGGAEDFNGRAASFELTLLVDGPLVQASINGKPVGRYHTVDGAPIEGQIGFATSMGAIDVENARVTRLERSRLAPSASFAPTCFDLATARSLAPWDAQNRTCVSLPKVPQGTLLLWLAPPLEPFTDDVMRAAGLQKMQWDLRELATLVERGQPTQRIVIAVPEVFGESGRKFVDDYAKKVVGSGVETILHQQPFLPDGVTNPRGRRWLLFLDSAGIVRTHSELPSGVLALDDKTFKRWLTVFREHGRPPRELPEVERPRSEEEESSGD